MVTPAAISVIKFASPLLIKSASGLFSRLLIGLKWEEAIESALIEVDNVVQKVEGILPTTYWSRLESYFRSNEGIVVARQIWANSAKIESVSEDAVRQIEASFQESFFTHLDFSREDSDAVTECAKILFRGMTLVCERAISSDAGQHLRRKLLDEKGRAAVVIIEELALTNRLLTDLRAFGAPTSQAAIQAFIREYCFQMASRHRYVKHPDFDAKQRLQLKDIFVDPRFREVGPKPQDKEPQSFDFEQFVVRLQKTVLLGNPGGGKSTAAQRICLDMSEIYHQHSDISTELLVPILIHVRNFANDRRETKLSIIEHIEQTTNVELTLKPPNGAIEHLFLTGKALVVFDGLDEVLEAHERQEIAAIIESFCNRFPAAPVLVTSRVVGYAEASLNPSVFEVFQLEDFNDNQVREYVSKWFVLAGYNQTEADKIVEEFVEESSAVNDLRANPLMLALMCNLYRKRHYIPKNRPELYSKCTEILLSRDTVKGIKNPLPFQHHIVHVIRFLAHWIFTTERLNTGVRKSELVEKSTEFLLEEKFETRAEAEAAAKEFVQHCTARLWVFTDMGPEIYKFAHNTFLEFYSAEYLVSVNGTSKELADILLPRIRKQEWDVVAQIAVQIQNERLRGAGSEFLEQLMQSASGETYKVRAHLLNFALRSLEFMVPRPQVMRSIIESCVQLLIENAVACHTSMSSETDREYLLMQIVDYVPLLDHENRATVSRILEEILEKTYSELSIIERRVLFEYLLHMRTALTRERRCSTEDAQYWSDFSKGIMWRHTSKLKQLSECDPILAGDIIWEGYIALSSVVQWHGREFLISDYSFISLPKVYRSSFAQWLFHSIFWWGNNDHYVWSRALYDMTSQFGKTVCESFKPFLEPVDNTLSTQLSIRRAGVASDQPAVVARYHNFCNNPDALFGLFVLLAIKIEMYPDVAKEDVEVFRSLGVSIYPALSLRGGEFPPDFVPEYYFQSLKFNEEQTQFATQWLKGKLNLFEIAKAD